MNCTRKILSTGYSAFNGVLSAEEFKKVVGTAAETGFTHVDIGCAMLERSRHQLTNNGFWCKDYDFYPEYTAVFPGFFKFYVPEKLRPYLPEDTAKRNLESMHTYAEIVQAAGLKGSFLGGEPQFLPEAAFKDHPEWRGARCDFAGRSMVAYFSPCIDQPEILDLYSQAADAICDAAPCLEYVQLLTGDSGNGICWGELYTGSNGPEFCRSISSEQRVSTYCNVLADSMKKHGHKEPMAILHRSPPWGRSIPIRKPAGAPGGTVYSVRGCQDKPVCHEDPFSIMEELVKADGYDNVIVNVEAAELVMRPGSVCPEVIKSAFESTPTSTLDILSRIKAAVEKTMPEADADKITEGFYLVSQALRTYQSFLTCNFFYGSMSERWLTRPFLPCVPPMDSEETAYYRNHIFSVMGEKAFRDYLDFHGGRYIRFGKTPEEANNSAFICLNVIEKLDKAIKCFGPETDAGWRARALRVLVKNIRHLLLFNSLLDKFRETGTPDKPGFQNMMRAEADNCSEMITILENGPSNVIHLAKTKEEENTFRFGPDLADQLRIKREQMFDHWHDLDDITNGRRAFEG